MHFDPTNPVIQLCAQGMESESGNDHSRAKALFQKAWEIAANDFEKCTAAHYVARHQEHVSQKLEWDNIALSHALAADSHSIAPYLPSLYLNIGKGYEELGDYEKALDHYHKAQHYSSFLAEDNYGKLILSGIVNGISRIQNQKKLQQPK